MEKYERKISFKTLFLSFIRRYDFMVMVLLPLLAVTVIFTQVINKKNYYSEVSLKYYDSVISEDNYKKIYSIANSEGTAIAVANGLKSDNFHHANGSEITSTEILSGLSFERYVPNTVRFNYSFLSTDSSIVKKVLENYTDFVLYTLKTDKTTSSTLGGVSIAEPPSDPKLSNQNQKNLLLGAAVGVAASIVLGFAAEIILDEIYDKNDVESLGASGFEISLPKPRKEK